jgi:LPS export ABC transporter permease LptF/LPS export ABC transporter permease LptG
MRLIDRYIIREILLPFVIALVVLTFLLIIPFLIEQAEILIAKGVAWPIIARLMLMLVPAQLGLTIPMALLIAILVAFGRFSADREIVVMMACGVSPLRLLRPVLLLSTLAAAATAWVMIEAIPDANQTFREITLRVVADRAEGQVRPREFFADFPDTVLYVREVPPDGGWKDVFAADTRNPMQPVIYLARTGRMIVNREKHTIEMVLEDGVRHTTNANDPAVYRMARFVQLIVSLDPESVFPRAGPARGEREMTIAELEARIADLKAQSLQYHNPVMEIQKKFSLPAACLVFALVGVGLGISNRKDGKLASFVLGIAVIFIYYVAMFMAQSLTKGALIPAWLAMWVPNILLGAAGLALIGLRSHGIDQAQFRLPSFSWLQSRTNRSADPAATSPSSAPALRRRGGTVIVIRVPQFQLPRPNLLDLYIARTYVRTLVMCVVGLMGVFYITTFIDLSDKLFKGQVPLEMILSYLWWATPQFLYYIIAIAVLLAGIVTIGALTKNSELIVMRACGISIYRTALPLLVFAALASTVLFTFEERILAVTNRRAEFLRHVIRGGSPQTFDVLNRKWLIGSNGEIYHYQFYDPTRRELNSLSVLRFDPATEALAERVFASQAAYAGTAAAPATWIAKTGWTRTFAGTEVTLYAPMTSAPVALEPADYFMTEAPAPERMNFDELRRYIEELKASGYTVLEHEVALQRKFAFPLVPLIMTLIAVPFAVTTGKRGALYGVGIGIALALVYWTAISVFAAFGAGGAMSPTLAAWAPNLLFGSTAAYLLLTVRT